MHVLQPTELFTDHICCLVVRLHACLGLQINDARDVLFKTLNKSICRMQDVRTSTYDFTYAGHVRIKMPRVCTYMQCQKVQNRSESRSTYFIDNFLYGNVCTIYGARMSYIAYVPRIFGRVHHVFVCVHHVCITYAIYAMNASCMTIYAKYMKLPLGTKFAI